MVPRPVIEAMVCGLNDVLLPVMGWAAGLAVVWLVVDMYRRGPRLGLLRQAKTEDIRKRSSASFGIGALSRCGCRKNAPQLWYKAAGAH